jgi:tRNA G46 methylase TrmB
MTLQELEPLYDKVSCTLENAHSNYLVIQIGSSSGKEIAHFAKIFPQHEFIGTDIYDEVIEYASDYHNYSNLSFVKCSAKEIANIFNINVKIQPIKITLSPILVFASGSLNYVQPEHLTIFFNSLF